MFSVTIPGWKTLQLSHLVLDYNGTLAFDGRLLDGVKERLIALAASVTVHILTADTFGSVREALADTPCRLAVIPVENQAEAKRAYVDELIRKPVPASATAATTGLCSKRPPWGSCGPGRGRRHRSHPGRRRPGPQHPGCPRPPHPLRLDQVHPVHRLTKRKGYDFDFVRNGSNGNTR